MITIKSDNLDGYLERVKDAIVMVGSERCKMCRNVKDEIPLYETKYPGMTFLFLDGDQFPHYADRFGVEYYPTFILFKFGRYVGKKQTSDIKKLFKTWN